MLDIRSVFSLCFIFSSILINGLTIIYLFRLNADSNKKQNLYAIVAILLIHSLYVFVAILGWYDWQFVDYGAPFATLYGPLLWHFTQMSKKKNHDVKSLKWHLLPFLFLSIAYVYCLTNPENTDLIKFYTKILYLTAEIQFVIYLTLSIVVMKRLKSSDERALRVKKTFFNYLFLLAAITIFLFLTATFDQFFIPRNYTLEGNRSYTIHLLFLGVSILFHLGVGKEGNLQQFVDVFNPVDNATTSGKQAQEKYQTEIKKRTYLEIIAGKIQALPDEIFKDPNLSLHEFAQIIDEPHHLITQTFSVELNTNFNQYLNGKRIDFATQLLLSEASSELSIADIAYQSGFNSEASFYRVFKAHYKTSPRQFQKKNKASNS